jgi:integrase/recombinase XerC
MRTISRKLSSLKSYGKYIRKNKNIDTSFLDTITLPKRQKKLPEYLHDDELEILLNLPINTFLEIRNLLIIHLLYSTGLRLSELTSLKLKDYNVSENIFRIKGKGKKERIVIFSNKCRKILELYLKERISDCEFLLVNKNGTKLSNRGVEVILNNISMKYLGHAKLHPHMLRHTFATKLLNKGMDLRNLQELLGHDSLTATQIYTHVAKSELLELYTTYHPRSDNES